MGGTTPLIVVQPRFFINQWPLLHITMLLEFTGHTANRSYSTQLFVSLQTLRQACTRLENRSQLVTIAGLGPKVFLNCSGFIKIDTASISETTSNYIEVLDGSRVHPETYEWAKKMAVDALEYDEVRTMP